MHRYFVAALLAVFSTAAMAQWKSVTDTGPVYLLFVNTSSHPFRVTGITLAGKSCATCADRTIAPGTVTLVNVGDPGSKHLKLSVTGGGSGACHYDISSGGSSENGDCGSSPKIAYVTGVHSEFMFTTKGTPRFDLFYAYDPVKGE